MSIFETEEEIISKEDKQKKHLRNLVALKRELKKKQLLTDPRYYGLPDLLFPINYHPARIYFKGKEYVVSERIKLDSPESAEEYKRRRYHFLKVFVHDNLNISEEGQVTELRLADPVLSFIADMFFGYVQRAILWKSRGGGGSLAAAVIMWLKMIYQCRKFVMKAGSQKQAKNMYNYTKGFWDCFPALKSALMDGDPLNQKTLLKTGALLECTTTSQSGTRGDHSSGLCLDELCQENASIDEVFKDAINGSLSKSGHCIILLSTFHVPIGLFQEYWDNAAEKGFARYKWSIFQIMRKCHAGMEFASKDDPKAKDFCLHSCPLTKQKSIREYHEGRIQTYVKNLGCQGEARDSRGWMKRSTALTILKANVDEDKFFIEFGTDRPSVPGTIYPSESIDDATRTELMIPCRSVYSALGIDWGLTEGCMVYVIITHEYLAVPWVRYLNSQALNAVKENIQILREDFGEFEIYADSNPPLVNQEMIEQGYDITPVNFALLKDFGIKNLYKFFNHRKIAILDDTKDGKKLLQQLLKYKRNMRTGQIEKKEDHGCDALLCAAIEADFDSLYGSNRTVDLNEDFFLTLNSSEKEKSSKDNNDVLFF